MGWNLYEQQLELVFLKPFSAIVFNRYISKIFAALGLGKDLCNNFCKTVNFVFIFVNCSHLEPH